MSLDPPEVAALRDLHRVLLLVTAERRLDDVLETAASGVSEVLGFGCVAINLLTACGDFEAVTVVGPARGTVLGCRYPAADFEAELAAADDWGLLRFLPAGRYDDLAVSATTWRTDAPPLDHPDAWLAEDALYAPLRGPDGELVGIMSLDLPADGRRPGPRSRAILEMYAAQVGVAVGQARERERLAERARLAASLREIASITTADAAALEPGMVLESSVAPLVRGFLADQAWVLLDGDADGTRPPVSFPADLGGLLRQVSAQDEGWPALEVDRAFRAAARYAEQCWREQRALVVCDGPRDSSDGVLPDASRRRVLGWLDRLGSDQFVLVPIGAARRCLGYAVLSRPATAGEFTAAEDHAAIEVGRELGRVVEVARAREREQGLRRRLEELDAHRTRVITTVVHELKNPLTAILGNLELVREDPSVAERAHRAIATGGERMLALVEDMLTLTRLREPAGEDRGEVDLTDVVLGVGEMLRSSAEPAGVALDLSAVEPGARLRGDRQELERLVVNLVSNAVKFSDAGDVVRLELAHSVGLVVLLVADEGLGISAEDQQRLFVEFERSSDPRARSRPGSGLGLAIAARVAERHGARIDVASTPGRGSTFAVRFPAARSAS